MRSLAILLSAWLWISPLRAQLPSPHAIEVPPWFTESLLELRDDVREAAAQGKRVLLYFGQDGCPYCTARMQTNFSRRAIADKTRRRHRGQEHELRRLHEDRGKGVRESCLA